MRACTSLWCCEEWGLVPVEYEERNNTLASRDIEHTLVRDDDRFPFLESPPPDKERSWKVLHNIHREAFEGENPALRVARLDGDGCSSNSEWPVSAKGKKCSGVMVRAVKVIV